MFPSGGVLYVKEVARHSGKNAQSEVSPRIAQSFSQILRCPALCGVYLILVAARARASPSDRPSGRGVCTDRRPAAAPRIFASTVERVAGACLVNCRAYACHQAAHGALCTCSLYVPAHTTQGDRVRLSQNPLCILIWLHLRLSQVPGQRQSRCPARRSQVVVVVVVQWPPSRGSRASVAPPGRSWSLSHQTL